MKRVISFIILFIYIIVFIACSGRKTHDHKGHSHDSHQHGHHHGGHDHDDHHEHNHGDEPPSIKYSEIVEGVEIFVEYPALVLAEPAEFIAHFTNLINYKPISDAKVSLVSNGKQVFNTDKVLRNGIFILDFLPSKSGTHSLKINLEYAGRTYSFNLKETRVFTDGHDAFHAEFAHHEPDIVFLKEQAWVGDFGVIEVKKKAFNSMIHTSGRILPAVDNRITLVAQSSGIIDLPKNMVAGKKLKKGERIASIKSGQLENSREVAFKIANAGYHDIGSRYQIAAKLVKENSISRKEFSQLEAEHNRAKAKLEVFGKFNDQGEFIRNNETTGSGAMNINSPRACHVANVKVRNGDYAEQGSVIATLVVGDSYLLKVDFPKHEISKMQNVVDANFVPEYMDASKMENGALSVSGLGGYPLFNSKTSANDSPYIPFYFNLPDDPGLIPNSFVSVAVESKPEILKEVITVPVSAVLENENSYWVYVELEGENYTKREVMVGDNNGKEIVITDGLEVGEIVVNRGAFRVKQASMSLDMPEHTH